jgi:predicted metal-dependent peptidase
MTVPSERSYELTEAISALIAQQPFFAVYLLDMMRIEESECVPTAGTNGRTIYVNPKFFGKLATAERVFVLCHEVLHGIMQHPERGQLYKDRGVGPDLKEWSHARWNIATDYIINDTLVQGQVGKAPAMGLFNPNFGKDDLADEVYEKIPDQDENGWDTHMPPDPNNPAPSTAQVQRALKSAEAAAKAQGKMPSSLQRIVDDICEAQVTWQEYLRKTITTMAGKDQCTWARPNRRKLAVAPHIYWPGRAGSVTGPVAVEIDTSGSISDKELTVFMSELHGIFSDATPEKLYLMYVDAQRYGDIIEIDDVNQLLDARKKAGGGGGTDMTVIFKEIEQNQLPVQMAIIFTDGYTPFGEDPGYEVIWCITTDTKAPFGTTINIKIPH